MNLFAFCSHFNVILHLSISKYISYFMNHVLTNFSLYSQNIMNVDSSKSMRTVLLGFFFLVLNY